MAAVETVSDPLRVDSSHPVRAFWRIRRFELLGAITFFAFVAWPLLRPSRLIEGFDTYAYSAPNDAVSFRALESWRLPEWNPTIFGGVPHLANPQVALFNPLKLPFVSVEPWRALVLITALHLLVLTVGMVVLAHRLRLRPPAGFVAAVALVGSGMVAGKSLQYPQITVVAGIPWLLTAIDLVLDRPSRPRRAIAWLAIATAFLCVSGHPQMTYLAFVLGGAWTLSRAFRHRASRDLWRIAAGFALGVALAAIQLLPSVALLSGAAERASTFISDPLYVLHRSVLPVTLLGDIWAPRVDMLSKSFESMSYVGAAIGAVALLGTIDTLRRAHERAATVVLLVTCGIAFWLSWGGISPLYRLARDVVPLFKQARTPARWIVLVTIIAAILAAQGVDAAIRRRLDRRAFVVLGVVVIVIVAALAVGPFETPVAKTNGAWIVAAVIAIAACASIALGSRWWVVAGVALLVIVIVLELGAMARHGPLRDASTPASISSTSGAAADYLRARGGRIISMTQDRPSDPIYMIEGLRPNVNSLFDIRSIDGYDGGPQVRETWIEAANALTDGPVNTELTLRAGGELPLDRELYARFGVRWALVDTSVVPASYFVPDWGDPVVTSGTKELFENPRYSGDAFVYHATRRVARRPGKALRAMDDEARRTVALVGPDGPRLRCDAPCERTDASVRRETPEHLVVRARTDEPGLLVLTEQFDEGWSAEIDDTHADVVKVDGFMLGVRVPAGEHDVTFRYRAPLLPAGAVISLAAAVVVVVLLVIRRRRRTSD